MAFRWFRIAAVVVVLIMVDAPAVWAQAKEKKEAASTSKKTEEAYQLFRTGQYAKAAEFFKAILQKHPEDKQAQIGLARCYYQQQNWADALLHFRKANLDTLDPEASYEYAQTFYHYELYGGALKGFKRVPRDHSLYNLAQYFGGIAALKLKRYQEANDLMEGAVNLPENYQLQKEVYQRHIQLLLLRQQKRELAKDAKDTPTSATASDPKAPKPFSHMGFFELYKDALAGVKNNGEKLEFMSGRKESSSRLTRHFTFENGIIHPLQKEGERRHVVGFQLFLYADHKDDETLQRSDYLDQPDVLRRTKEFTKTGLFALTMFSEIAFPSYFWLGLQGGLFQAYPDFGKKLSFSAQHGEIWFGQKKYEDGYEGRLRARLTQTRDPDGRVSINEQEYAIETEKKILDGLELSLYAQRNEFFYKMVGISGPDSRVRGGAIFEFKFPYNFEIELKGRYQKEINSTLYNIAGQSEVAFDTASGRGEIEAIFYPVAWLELRARFAQESQWLDKDDKLSGPVLAGIKDAEYSKLQETALEAALNMLF